MPTPTAPLPLLGFADLDAVLMHRRGRAISRGEFLRATEVVAAQLAPARYAINLCRDRYAFALAFAAACLRGQTNLLPANQVDSALEQIKKAYPDHRILNDEEIDTWTHKAGGGRASTVPPSICSAHVAAICFTSGSTGAPQAHPSTWGTLVASARRSTLGIFAPHLDLTTDMQAQTLSLVATVPPQHMFGLETTILQPLVNRCAVDTDRPFFPADVGTALAATPAPRALIGTPAHLRTCLAANTAMPPLQFVLSATAPMSMELAAEIESRWHTQVLEIYGSTETGAIATRRTTNGPAWQLLPGGSLQESASGLLFAAQPAHDGIPLHDVIERIDATHFALAGRNADLIKVAGKRASLGELNARLLAIPGVRDGIVFQPVDDRRVAALVVVDGLTERDILQALSAHIDEVFLPRPLRLVESLPRDAVGKVSRAALLNALASGDG